MSGYWPHNGYYVYSLAYPDGTVFYVGKGQGRRIQDHVREAKAGVISSKNDIIRSIWASGEEVIVTKLYTDLSEQEALRLEQEVIDTFDFDALANQMKQGHHKWVTPEWRAWHSRIAKETWERIKANEETEKIMVRFPSDLLEDLKQFAQEDKRSFNLEVVWILTQYAKQRKGGRSHDKDIQVSSISNQESERNTHMDT